jgi:hypothetical protein
MDQEETPTFRGARCRSSEWGGARRISLEWVRGKHLKASVDGTCSSKLVGKFDKTSDRGFFRGSLEWWSFWGRVEDRSRRFKHVNRRRTTAGTRSPQGSGRWFGGWKLQSFLYGGNRHLQEPPITRPIPILGFLPDALLGCTWVEPSFPVGVTWAEMGRNLGAPTMYERDGWWRDEGSGSIGRLEGRF